MNTMFPYKTAQDEANRLKRPVRLYKIMLSSSKYYTVADGEIGVQHPPTATFIRTFNPKTP